jgi:arsenate reductase (glutaredoxin)
MIQLYGIKNCDTMKKAFTWLDKKKVAYTFHDYKKEGIDEDTLKIWLKKIPLDKLINIKGSTWRLLSEKEKASITSIEKATKLMMEKTSIIKRPLVVVSKGNYILGFNEEEWKSKF